MQPARRVDSSSRTRASVSSSASASASSSSSSQPSPAATIASSGDDSEITVKSRGSSFHILRFPSKSKKKTSRSGQPKTRAGCITCKKRHVKCDETRPSCLRCIKYRNYCEGYGNASVEDTRIVIEPSSEMGNFVGDGEPRNLDYWLFFLNRPFLFPSETLNHTIPQLSHRQSSLKHAALAIGAIALSFKVLADNHVKALSSGKAATPAAAAADDPPPQESPNLQPGGEHFKQGLVHYGRAMRQLAGSKHSRESMHAALLSCVLFYPVEAILGSKSQAFRHLGHGYSILQQFVEGHDRDRDSEMVHIYRSFTAHSWLHDGLRPDHHSTPNAAASLWCCRGGRKTFEIDEMPDDMPDGIIARRWWDTVQHNILYRVPNLRGQYGDSPHLLGRLKDPRPATSPHYPPTPPSPISTPPASSYLPAIDAAAPSAAALQMAARYLLRYRKAFTPLFQTMSQKRDTQLREYVQVLSMDLLQTSLTALVAANFYEHYGVPPLSFFPSYAAPSPDDDAASPPTDWLGLPDGLAALNREFKSILRSTEIMIESVQSFPPVRGMFTVEMGPTFALWVLAVHCRDEAVRQHAAAVMMRFPPVEALWDIKGIIHILEEWVPGPPEWLEGVQEFGLPDYLAV